MVSKVKLAVEQELAVKRHGGGSEREAPLDTYIAMRFMILRNSTPGPGLSYELKLRVLDSPRII